MSDLWQDAVLPELLLPNRTAGQDCRFSDGARAPLRCWNWHFLEVSVPRSRDHARERDSERDASLQSERHPMSCSNNFDFSAGLRAVKAARIDGLCKFANFRVRDCQVLLLSSRTKGCFFAPPYLDDYGETDQGLK